MCVYRYGGTYNITCVFMCMRIPSFSWVNVAKNAWFAPAKRPRCFPVRVLGFDQPVFQGFYQPEPARVLGFFASRSTGGCFSSGSAEVLPAGVLGFYQPKYWSFTSRSAGIFTSRSAEVFTSRSAGVLPAGVLRFLTAGVLEFYQPKC